MRFTVATVLACASSALAAISGTPTDGFDPVYTPEKDAKVPAGKPFKITWDNPAPYENGEIFIQVLGGPSFDKLQVIDGMDKIATLDSSEKEFTWDVDSSLGDDATYGIRLVWAQDESIIQWSSAFTITKADGSSTVTMTSSQGVKTISLASSTPNVTSSASTVIETSTSAAPNTTIARNTTTPATTMSRTTSEADTTTASQTSGTTNPSASPSSGAARVAGSVAAVGGLFAAFFAL